MSEYVLHNMSYKEGISRLPGLCYEVVISDGTRLNLITSQFPGYRLLVWFQGAQDETVAIFYMFKMDALYG